jgi:hypothetical protein
MTSDTPRTDACPHCGSQTEIDSFFRTTCGNLLDYREGNIGKIAGERTELCHEIEVSNLWRKRAEKAEAEVERLKAALQSCWHAANTYDGNYTRACDNVATIAINALKTQ